jgi:hypothetical protein
MIRGARAASVSLGVGRAAAHRVRVPVAARVGRVVTIEAETRAPSPLRRLRRGGLVALGGLIVWTLVGLPFFVFPTVDRLPAHADVVLVLGPPLPQRVAAAERLLAEHRVGTALVSVPGDPAFWHVGAFCARSDVICFAPDPSTTRGEARELRAEAALHGWTSAVVTTMPAQIPRARTLVGRCFSGTLSMDADTEPPYNGIAYQYLYQTAATVKAWILQGC